jgi:hypothetical protein
MNDMKLVFIYGAPGVGKLTVARALATLTGFRLFHNHLTVDLVSSLFEFGTDPFIRMREEIWLTAFREAAQQNVSFIFTFAPERTVRGRFIQDTFDAINSAGGRAIFIELSCEQGELERRIQDPSRSEFGKLSSIEQYRALKESGAFDFPILPQPELSLDITDSSPTDAAELIYLYISQRGERNDAS